MRAPRRRSGATKRLRRRDRRRRTDAHDRLPDHRSRHDRGHQCGDEQDLARRASSAYDQATGFGLCRRWRRSGSRRFGSAASAQLAGRRAADGVERRRRSPSLDHACCQQRPFSGYWEYHIEDALFTSPPRGKPQRRGALQRARRTARHRQPVRGRRPRQGAARCPATCSCRSTCSSRSSTKCRQRAARAIATGPGSG